MAEKIVKHKKVMAKTRVKEISKENPKPKAEVKKIAKPSVLEKQHNSCQIKNLGDKMQVFDSTLTTKQTEHAGLPFLPLFKIKEEGNGN